jgi:predicted Zn-dependent protease
VSLTRDEAQGIIRRTLAMSKADETEVSIEANREANLRYANNEVSTSGDVSNVVITVGASFGKRRGAASINQSDDASLRRVVQRAEETARFAPEDPESMPLLGEQKYGDRSFYDESTANAAPETRANVARHAIELAKKTNLVAAGFMTNSGTISALGNSRGLFAYDRLSRTTFSNTVRTREGNGSGWAGTNADRLDQMNAAALIDTAAEKAVMSKNARTLAPGTYTVILEPAAVADLLYYLSFQMNARSADEGRSFFAKKGGGTKVGEKVLSEKVTIWSDPADPRAPGMVFTDEGLPTARTTWIENGVLKNLVYSRFWADKMKAEPVPSPVNVIMKGGNGSIADLVKSTKNGVLVTRLWYIRFLDPQSVLLTGLTRDGVFKIENGKIRHALRNFRFNDTPISVFSKLDAMSREVRTRGSESEDFSIVAPAVRTQFTFSSASEAV